MENEKEKIVNPDISKEDSSQPTVPEPQVIVTETPISQVKKKPKIKKYILFGIIIFIILSITGASAYYFLIIKSDQNKSLVDETSVEPSILPEPTSLNSNLDIPDEVKNTSLYFIKDDNKLYKMSPLGTTPEVVLANVETYSFSPDGEKLAYIKGYGPGSDNSVYVKDTKTGITELQIESDEWSDNRGIKWSPN